MSEPKVEVIVKNGAKTIGEGPHWEDSSQTLLYVDILAGDVHRWNPATGEDVVKHVDNDPVSLVVPIQGGGYMLGVGRTLARWDWDSNSLSRMEEVDKGTKNRFNDGKADPVGRLWAGTMGHETVPANPERQRGSLFCLDKGKLTSKVDKIDISNGLAWSLDHKTMFYIDSIPRKVFAFDYNKDTGDISNQRVAVDFGEGTVDTLGFPDGMTIDTEGKLWVACYGVGKVIQFDPETGKALRTINFPALRTTSCCFGGKNLDELYVTSGRQGVSDEEFRTTQPEAGSVFRVTNLGAKGLPAFLYQA